MPLINNDDLESDVEGKRGIIGSIFSEKLIFQGEKHRTGKVGSSC